MSKPTVINHPYQGHQTLPTGEGHQTRPPYQGHQTRPPYQGHQHGLDRTCCQDAENLRAVNMKNQFPTNVHQ